MGDEASYDATVNRAIIHLETMGWEDLLLQYSWWRDKQDQAGATLETKAHLEVINALLKVV